MNPDGRPPLYKTPEQMQEAIDKHFADCREREEPLTMCGLALTLGMSRQALSKYKEKDEFVDTIKNARLQVEQSIESGLLKGYNPAGAIFNLKNNFDWKDKTEVDQKISLTDLSDEQLNARLNALITGSQD